jgi:hypothetical protein
MKKVKVSPGKKLKNTKKHKNKPLKMQKNITPKQKQKNKRYF